jgi:hypothetical protein
MTENDMPHIGLERGAYAIAALSQMNLRSLAAIRARATFRPIREDEIVPVLPCEVCRDGGLRVVGRVRSRGCYQRVHVCDTCGVLRFYDLP